MLQLHSMQPNMTISFLIFLDTLISIILNSMKAYTIFKYVSWQNKMPRQSKASEPADEILQPEKSD